MDLGILEESRSFGRNKRFFVIFYSGYIFLFVGFVILCTLSAWSLSLGGEISTLVGRTMAILKEVDEILPMMRAVCRHENFTRTYGNVC